MFRQFHHDAINMIGPPKESRTLNPKTWPSGLSRSCIPFPASEALLGRSEKIRTFNTHGLSVRPLPIGIRFHSFVFCEVSDERKD